MKTLLIVEKNPSGSLALKKAKERGLYVIYIGSNKYKKITKSDEKYLDKIINIDINNVQSVIKKCIELNEVNKIDGVVTFLDYNVPLVAQIAEKLNLPRINYLNAINVRNKFFMREALLKRNISIPKFKKVNSYEDINEFISSYGFPNIIKPVNMCASRNIFINNDENELYKNFNVLKNAYPPFGVKRENYILIEEYMYGQEFSVESITYDGETNVIAITKKYINGNENFVEIGHTTPIKLSKKLEHSIKNITCDAIKALGINQGVTHTEIKLTNGGFKIVEVAARPGGDRIPELVELSTGIDLFNSAISIALGEKPKINRKKNLVAAIKFIIGKPGILKSISGIDNIRKCNNIYDIEIEKKIGDKINKLECSGDRIGNVIALGKDELDAECLVLNAISKLDIVIN
ncbi:ATP-grasp domain-containing protein [Eubacterium multiforme]|uniref:Biotin carboxylase n=1 Tax=Eubacterium multiforme TaxID=83339 RepID=A0ABT9UTK5_9FIRM|nr:ATP-grasp domain-containing protein [Eubacterium multiforme]MDQ0149662.1 biotin carboxylase [Eubacterium multiforme]